VRLTRAWHRENKAVRTLKGIELKLRKATPQQAARGAGAAASSRNGTMAPIVSADQLLGEDGRSTDPEFDAWLQVQDSGIEASGIYVITTDADASSAQADSSAAGGELAEASRLLREQQEELLALRQELADMALSRVRTSPGGADSSPGMRSPAPTLPRAEIQLSRRSIARCLPNPR
jgi:HAMP domain-containing protein